MSISQTYHQLQNQALIQAKNGEYEAAYGTAATAYRVITNPNPIVASLEIRIEVVDFLIEMAYQLEAYRRIQALIWLKLQLYRQQTSLDQVKLAFLYYEYAYILLDNQEITSFRYYAYEALAAFSQLETDEAIWGKCITQNLLGSFFLNIHDYQLAEYYYVQALDELARLEHPDKLYTLYLLRQKLAFTYIQIADEIYRHKNTIARTLLVSFYFVTPTEYLDSAKRLTTLAQEALNELDTNSQTYQQERSILEIIDVYAAYLLKETPLQNCIENLYAIISQIEEMLDDSEDHAFSYEFLFHYGLALSLYGGMLEQNSTPESSLSYYNLAHQIFRKIGYTGKYYWLTVAGMHSFSLEDNLKALLISLQEELALFKDYIVESAICTSNRQFLIIRAQIDNLLDVFLTILFQYASLYDDPHLADIYAYISRYIQVHKAMYAEIVRIKHHMEVGPLQDENHHLLQELNQARLQFTALNTEGPNHSEVSLYRNKLFSTGILIENLENTLFRFSDLSSQIFQAVYNAPDERDLPLDTILIKFYTYQNLISKNRDTFYYMFVSSNSQSHMVLLGKTDEVDSILIDFIGLLSGNPPSESRTSRILEYTINPSKDKQQAYTSIIKEKARELYDRLFIYLSAWVNQYTNWWILGEGYFARIPFETLIDENGDYLLQHRQIHYLHNIFQIQVPQHQPTQPSNPSLVIADPDYQTSSETQFVVNPLPGALVEGMQVAELIDAKLLSGKDAQKETILAHTQPHVLHIATHGFVLPYLQNIPTEYHLKPDGILRLHSLSPLGIGGFTREKWFFSSTPMNPLYHSFLVLSGFNAWLGGKELAQKEGNGLLTAGEIQNWNLSGTKLVVLSACESSVSSSIPDKIPGSYIFSGYLIESDYAAQNEKWGMYPYFFLAGAQNLIGSLWEVDDKATQSLMEKFYTTVISGDMTISQALRQAKLEMLQDEHWESPYFWSGFLTMGYPNIYL